MWLAYFFVGVSVGIMAFIMEIFENFLVDLRDLWTTNILENTENN
jgi:hypothetical protein